MSDFVDPQIFGLNKRDRIVRTGTSHMALIIERKSRIIMADGRKILEKVNKIRQTMPDTTVSLKTNAPVCSKTRIFLLEHGIEITELEKF